MELKWIKLCTNIFDDEKIALIESMPDADSIIVIWFKILCLAGKQNNCGVLMLSDRIPYTEEMLATIFRRPISTVRLALTTFESFGMIEAVNGTITIPNWEKHQSVDKLAELKEYNRLAQQKSRAKKRALQAVNDMSMTCQRSQGIEEDIDKDIENNIHTATAARIDYQHYVDLYNSHCSSLPQVKTLNEKRKRLIKRVAKEISEDDLLTALNKANTNSFLRGDSGGWKANFDWLMNPDNITKVLEGNYDRGKTQNSTNKDYDTDFGVVIEV